MKELRYQFAVTFRNRRLAAASQPDEPTLVPTRVIVDTLVSVRASNAQDAWGLAWEALGKRVDMSTERLYRSFSIVRCDVT